MASTEAVANEPRLFVGQVPAECTEENLWPLFSPFGTVRNLHILRGPDSKPRGCAMVLFAKWSEAETAAESLEGTTTLSGAQGRPLVVHFANPRKLPPGQPPEGGLAPKKLFVGQVPRDVAEDMLRPFFEPYGDIEHINILRTQRGQSAGCGFVQFRKWAQAEAALEAHNGKTRLGNSEVPLVVKFADAKRRDQHLNHLGLGVRRPWVPDLKHMDPAAADFAAYQLGAQQWQNQGLLRGNPGLLGNNLLGNQLAQMQSLMPQQGYQGPYGQQNYLQNHPMMHSHHLPQIADEPFNPGIEDRLQEQQFAGSLAAQADPLASQLINTAANLGSLNLPKPASGQGTPSHPAVQATANPADLAQQLGRLSLGGLEQQVAGQGDPTAMGYAQNPGGPPAAYGAGSGSRLPVHAQAQAFPGSAPQLLARGGAPYNQQLLNLARGYMGGSALGRPWGQKIGSNDKYNEWKLFVGQVPLEATEETIWELFSPIGPILELYILRNNNGKSRGCAFVTYQSKAMAEKAITALNGCHMSSGKILVVKLAERSSANKASTPSSHQPQNLLDMYSVT